MIDYVHLFKKIHDYKEYLKSPETEFVEGIRYNSGSYLKYFWYKNPTNNSIIKIGYNNWLDYKSSITKFWFGENYSNMPYSDLACAIYELSDTLKTRPKMLDLKSFEFGLNIPIDFGISALNLTDLLLNYKTNFFENMESNSKSPSVGKRIKLQEYQLKFYSKSLQYALEQETLRYEIKINKMNFFRGTFRNFADLLDKKKLEILKNELLEKMSQTLIYDSRIDTRNLQPTHKSLLLRWQSEIYRKNLLNENPRKFNYQKKKVLELIENNAERPIRKILIDQISDLWDSLIES